MRHLAGILLAVVIACAVMRSRRPRWVTIREERGSQQVGLKQEPLADFDVYRWLARWHFAFGIQSLWTAMYPEEALNVVQAFYRPGRSNA